MNITKFFLIIGIFIFITCNKEKPRTDSENIASTNNEFKCQNQNMPEIIKIKDKFPLGIVTNSVTSMCSSNTLCKHEKKISKNTTVHVLNFDLNPEMSTWQVLLGNDLYCIPQNALQLKEKITVIEAKSKIGEPEVNARYILFPNKIFLSIWNSLPPNGELDAYEVIGGYGEFNKTKKTLEFCNFTDFYSNRKGDDRCLALTRTDHNAWAEDPDVLNDATVKKLQNLRHKGAVFWMDDNMVYTEFIP